MSMGSWGHWGGYSSYTNVDINHYNSYDRWSSNQVRTNTQWDDHRRLAALEQLRAIAKFTDREVLALTELRMEPEADRRLSELLDRQQASELSDLERAELAALMRTYEMGLLRQSQALAEVVRQHWVKAGWHPPVT